ncbi:MAG: gfo/Idh/MocA family oxidoreductase, partial [Actinomadura rubrobrunea]|nr:gfo/Idh/MocA family oxidoreductase [Actinomadura rubrobrunea]
MTARTLGVVMNGVTGRMGYRQHLLRSVLAINEAGGVPLVGGGRVKLRPILVGRSADKVRALAERHGIPDWTADLDAALADPGADIYFDAQVTSARVGAVTRAIDAGKH